MEKYSKDGKVLFNEDNHTYFLGDKQLTSVTTYIGKYKNEFKRNIIASRIAKRDGVSKEEVLAEWKAKGDYAREMGKTIHKIFEDYHEQKKIILPEIYDKEKPAVKCIEDIFETGRLETVAVEYIVYNDNLAGQIDMIAKNPKGEHFILDWKTNNSIDKEAYGNKKMLLDFHKYPDSNYYHYSIQLRVYQQLCKDYDIKDCFIVHIDEDSYKIMKTEKIKLKL